MMHLELDGRLVGDLRDPPAGVRVFGTVLLLHGGGQTRHAWADSAVRMTKHGWRTVAMDARGHGDSAWAADGNYSLDALVADLELIISALGERPVLVGASLGGTTALVAEGEEGGLARGLVLVDVVPKLEPDGVARILDFMSSTVGGFDSLPDVAAAVCAYNPQHKRPPRPEGLRKNVRRAADGRWYWHWDPAFLEFGDEPTRGERYDRTVAAAKSIAVPTLLVCGANSDVVAEDGVRELLDLVPHATHVDVADTGHMVAGDDNEAFTNGVLDFLDKLVEVGNER